MTWGTAGSLPLAQTTITGLVIGRTYTASAYFYVPSGGSPAALLSIAGQFSSSTTVTNTFQRRNVTWTATGTSHTLQVWPASAPTAGNQVWVDAVQVDEGSAAVTFSTAAPPIYYRFDGYVNEWPTQWAPTGLYAEAPVTASDRRKRLGSARRLPNLIAAEYLSDGPVAYYQLGDQEGSTAAGPASANPQPVLTTKQRSGVGGTITFGAATGPGTDQLSAPFFAPSSTIIGKYLSMSSPTVKLNGLTSCAIEAFFNSTHAQAQTIVSITDNSGSYFAIHINSAGQIEGLWHPAFGGTSGNVTASTSVIDGLTHHVCLSANVSGGNINMTLYLDGASNSFTAIADDNVLFGGFTNFNVGGDPVNEVMYGTIAHAACYASSLSAARILSHATAGSTGFSGETTSARIARLAGYAGVATAAMSLETGVSTVVGQDTTDQSAIDLIDAVAVTENGLAFMSRTGALTFQARSHRYNTSSSFTLTAGQYGVDLSPTLDDWGIQNDVTVTRQAGAVTRVVNQASIDDNGVYTGSIESLTTSDNEALDAANWRVNNYGNPRTRWPSVTVNIATQPTLIPTVLAAEISDQFALSGLPSQAPASTASVVIEGYSETFGIDQYSITFNCSPGGLSQAWVLDSATYSVLDSTTQLAY
jgi:hypothetical protein